MKALLPLIVAIAAISSPAFAQKDIMTEKTAGEIKLMRTAQQPKSWSNAIEANSGATMTAADEPI